MQIQAHPDVTERRSKTALVCTLTPSLKQSSGNKAAVHPTMGRSKVSVDFEKKYGRRPHQFTLIIGRLCGTEIELSVTRPDLSRSLPPTLEQYTGLNSVVRH